MQADQAADRRYLHTHIEVVVFTQVHMGSTTQEARIRLQQESVSNFGCPYCTTGEAAEAGRLTFPLAHLGPGLMRACSKHARSAARHAGVR